MDYRYSKKSILFQINSLFLSWKNNTFFSGSIYDVSSKIFHIDLRKNIETFLSGAAVLNWIT